MQHSVKWTFGLTAFIIALITYQIGIMPVLIIASVPVGFFAIALLIIKLGQSRINSSGAPDKTRPSGCTYNGCFTNPNPTCVKTGHCMYTERHRV